MIYLFRVGLDGTCLHKKRKKISKSKMKESRLCHGSHGTLDIAIKSEVQL